MLSHRIAHRRAESSSAGPFATTSWSKPLLGSFDRGIRRRRSVSGRIVIVRLNASVVTVRIGTSRRGTIVRLNVSGVIIRIVVTGIIRQVIPGIESGIQSEPEAVVKNKEPVVEEMC